MAETEELQGLNSPSSIIRDPSLAKNRIFLGNLPNCTSEQLLSICKPYGHTLCAHVQKNFGFVQFETTEEANRAAQSLNKSTFKKNIITVQNALAKAPGAPMPSKVNKPPTNKNDSKNAPLNHCEIIVIDRINTTYAEFIEQCLKLQGLRVDVLFPNEEVALGKVLANISARGCLYALLVTKYHVANNSVTLNILYGAPAEHRNMPVEAALKLITEDFNKKCQREQSQRVAPNLSQHTPAPVPIVAVGNATSNNVVPPLHERHPDAILVLLNMLSQNMPLTVLQYDLIIKYLTERRILQVKAELGDPSSIDCDTETQRKLQNIINKPPVVEYNVRIMYEDLMEVKQDEELMNLLRDERIRNALEKVYNSSFSDTFEQYL